MLFRSTDTNPAIIKCSLGALAKYPGYYINNDSFLNDAIYVQDSRYYQAYSYVIKIDEKLDAYKTIVKNLIHPSGMAVFGEYDIRNEFDLSESLECLLKYLVLTFHDNFVTNAEVTAKGVNKPINNHYLNDGITQDDNTISVPDTSFNLFSKLLNEIGRAHV